MLPNYNSHKSVHCDPDCICKSFVLLHMLGAQKAPTCLYVAMYASIYLSVCGLSPVSKYYNRALPSHIQRKLRPLRVLHHAAEHVNSAPRNDFQLLSEFKQDSVCLFSKRFCSDHIVSKTRRNKSDLKWIEFRSKGSWSDFKRLSTAACRH